MAVRQVGEAVQNDGNFCQLDLQDREFGGPLMRIETFRCNQPMGEYGTTAAGTPVDRVAGADHLVPISNRVFRHVFSVGRGGKPQVTLEFREEFAEDGSWAIRTRDLDPESSSFGRTLITSVRPGPTEDVYELRYEIREQPGAERRLVTSPLAGAITDLVPGLADLGAPLEELGGIDAGFDANPLDGYLDWRSDEADSLFSAFAANFQREPLATWSKNVQVYERFGDFRDKCIHPGTNLTGPHTQLASEFVPIRSYRPSLITLGRVCDPGMVAGTDWWGSSDPLAIDPKPGVYSIFLSAHILNIGIYQLGLDKVHSDYSGVPMALAPGSKLETGITPVVDSTRANRTLAELAVAFYLNGQTVPTLAKETAGMLAAV